MMRSLLGPFVTSGFGSCTWPLSHCMQPSIGQFAPCVQVELPKLRRDLPNSRYACPFGAVYADGTYDNTTWEQQAGIPALGLGVPGRIIVQ